MLGFFTIVIILPQPETLYSVAAFLRQQEDLRQG